MAVLPIRDLFSSQSLTNSTQIVERKKVFVSKKCGCLAYYIRDLSRSQSLTNITQTVSSCVQTTSRVFRRGGGASQRLVEDGPASVLERRRREERMVQLVSLSEESTVRSCSDWLTTAGPQVLQPHTTWFYSEKVGKYFFRYICSTCRERVVYDCVRI